MNASMYVGLDICSHDHTKLGTATLDNVVILLSHTAGARELWLARAAFFQCDAPELKDYREIFGSLS
jgi:hypothetical protein